MCLRIDTELHPKNKPRIAERDIVVYKALYDEGDKDCARSPYYNFLWIFGEKVSAKIDKPVLGYDFFGGYSKKVSTFYKISKGLHSATTKDGALMHALSVYPAIIPKGSRVIFGVKSDEVVSDNLIVYKDIKALQKVHGKVAKGVKKADIAI